MADIALIGASGEAGSRILKELSDRGHKVTGIARHPERIASLLNVTARRGGLFDRQGLADLLRGHDAVVSSVRFVASDPGLLIEAVRAAGVKRYLVVGGCGSLEIRPGVRMIDLPDVPEEYREEATRGGTFLDVLRQEKELDWTFLCPSFEFVPGTRTRKFRLGKDALLTGEDGRSGISFEDYAVALVDEIEQPAHSRQRFTVGY